MAKFEPRSCLTLEQKLVLTGSRSRQTSTDAAMMATAEQARVRQATRVGRCLLALACLSSVLLMVPMFAAGPLVLDEHGSYWIIDSDLPGSLLTRSLDYAAVPPLSGWLQQVSLTVLGKSEFAFRLPSAVCHLIAVLVIYALGAHIHDSLLGGIAALVLAWHPEALDEVRIARCYGLVLLLSSLVVLATWHWLKYSRSAKWVVVWTLSATGLLWTHYTSALLVSVAGAWLGLGSLRSQTPRWHFAVWVVSMGSLALICLPLIPAVLRLSEWGPYLNYMADEQPVWKFIGSFWWLGLPAGWIVSSIIGLTGREAGSFSRSSLSVLVVCSLLPLLLLAILGSGDLSSLANPRYRVAYVPASACLAAAILRRRSHWPAAVIGATTLLISSWMMSPLLPWQTGRLGSAAAVEWRDLSKYLAGHAQPGQAIFVQSGLVESRLVPLFAEDLVFMEYVACRVSRFYLASEHRRYGLPFVWNGGFGMREFFRHLVLQDTTSDDCWVAAATDTDLNRQSLAEMRQVAQSAGLVLSDHREWPNVTLERYSRPSVEEP